MRTAAEPLNWMALAASGRNAVHARRETASVGRDLPVPNFAFWSCAVPWAFAYPNGGYPVSRASSCRSGPSAALGILAPMFEPMNEGRFGSIRVPEGTFRIVRNICH
ncbi:hypothetical protein [Novosphingobium sp. SG720]|uniref:hypothetical protein n=1 Tax=Novosphingobium sp. SG720 TaxID=2586998 RepID=UPI001445A127|nr:hypothetical protein [Novosphingobium sp. SG720]NKJ44978.1 hypothetical protein [Novosphingobium sp. SG720]